MPVVCVWVPAFRLAVARLTQPGVDLDAPLVLADRIERGRVVDCTLTAAALGVRSGMTLVQAQAVATEARTVFDDPAADARVWAAVLEALDTISPVVEDGGLGRAFLDMHGIAGDPAAWLAALRGTLAAFDLPTRIGCGPNRFVAHAAAARGDGVVCTANPAAFLAPLPLDLLDQGAIDPMDERIRARLRLLGVTTLGGLAALPHGPFVRRFGIEAAAWHDRARGIDGRPLKPRARSLRVDRALYGEGEASSEEQVLFALRTLVGWVVDDLCAAGKRAGRLVLQLECEDGETRTLTTRVAQPTAVARALFELLRARLEGLVLTAPVTGLRLTAEELAGGGVTLSLFAASDPDPDAIGVVHGVSCPIWAPVPPAIRSIVDGAHAPLVPFVRDTQQRAVVEVHVVLVADERRSLAGRRRPPAFLDAPRPGDVDDVLRGRSDEPRRRCNCAS